MSLEARITNCQAARGFALAGKAIFTLRSAATGARYTFKVRKAKDKAIFFVSCLYGSANESDYAYLGIVDGENCFRVTAKSRFTNDSPQARAFEWTWRRLVTLAELPEAIEFWHEGRCGHCGRLLTVPESIASGIGPECAKKHGRPVFRAEAA